MSQMELIKEYFVKHPLKDIPHPEVVDWVVSEWKRRTGEVFRDPDRAIRKLYSNGFLQKVKKGVYKYDPELVSNPKLEDFSESQKKAIKERDKGKCAVCGRTTASGVEIHVDHIRPKDKGGKATLENGQLLCAEHNFRKKNYNQTEAAKSIFVNFNRLSKAAKDKKMKDFSAAVLKTYEAHDMNGHIEWKDDD